ncbi:MAG TPA: cytochrome c3 family protein [Mucilaginibacter sp.]|nr:cytochrome c3 family protein [Mucilaginibacter sp.]
MPKKKLFRLAVFLVPILLVFSQCLNLKKNKDKRGNAYAGSAACVSCHKGLYDSYLHTAHFKASRPASESTIDGSFAKGANEFNFGDHMKVVMSKTDSGYYQTSYINGKKDQSQRFDISFGGVKGQSYAYWLGNELFQLPISYVNNSDKWVNSPGYEPNRIAFERVIGTRCMDCHASYAKEVPPELPIYDDAIGFEKKSLIYSVDCERCHGPAAQHVKFQQDNPGIKKAKYITSYQSLTRYEKINMCAICHSGASTHMLKPTFSFKPGDTISHYMVPVSNVKPDYNHIDVHGDQKDLLISSKCFISSSMDCSTCHNTHVNEKNNLALYTNRCIACHTSSAADHKANKLTEPLSAGVLKNNCLSCHMPTLPSKAIVAGDSAAMVRTHHIAIYPEQTKKILAYLKAKNPGKMLTAK